MRRSILLAASLLRSLLAASLFAAPVTSAAFASAAVAFAQTADEPADLSGNPHSGPGWSGPANTAPPAVCPAWYGAHTGCVPASAGEPERAASPAFSTLESDGTAEAAALSPESEPAFAPVEAAPGTASSEEPYYGPGWSGPVNTAPPGICPAWYSTHTTCVPATSGADQR